MKKFLFAAVISSTLVGCQSSNKKTDEQVEKFSAQYIDSTADISSDFYHYAVGKWLKNNPIPADQSSWGSFEILMDDNDRRVDEILKKLSASKFEAGSPEQMVHDFYQAAMDSVQREKTGLGMLSPILQSYLKANTFTELVNLWTTAEKSGLTSPAPYALYVNADEHHATQNSLCVFQGGTCLPEKDYYLNNSPEMKDIRSKYVQHINTILGFYLPEASQKNYGETVLKLETDLASISMSMNEMRDPDRLYNKMSMTEYYALAPSFQLEKQAQAYGIKSDSIVVNQPNFLKQLNILAAVSLDNWKVYSIWQQLHNNITYLTPKMEVANFEFWGKTMNGQPQMRPAKKRAIRAINSNLGEPMGRLFVAEYFPEESKKYIQNMVEELRSSYKMHIEQLDWMSAETKKKALEKLAKFTYKIGYPDQWKDMSTVKIDGTDYLLSIASIRKFELNYTLSKIGKPVDKKEWGMNPHEVNAYYNPSGNEVVFPAGILQPPFFHISYDDALNYGGIGAVIGHEFTHGFDDQGAKYDGDGNRKDWWTTEDFAKFTAKGKSLADQFSSYEPIKGLPINGSMTLGENIADLGGLSIAFSALQQHQKGKETELIDGMKQEQRFFFSFANVWKGNERDESLRNQIMSDYHAPGPYRVKGTTKNMVSFYEAFGIPIPKDILKIW
jgi:putative endopeptidase